MGDGGRERALLEMAGWRSSQKWAAQRSAVRSIAAGRLLSEKSDVGRNRQKNPDCMQQFLNRRVEPQGHGSLRPSFSDRCLSLWTTRTPRLT
jgi:hypothetical protein